jgi:hypothetical protein
VYSKLKIADLRDYATKISNLAKAPPLPSHPPATRAVLLETIKRVHDGALFVPIKKSVNASKLDMVSIGRAIVGSFDRIIGSFDRIIVPYDASKVTVIIENQIGPIAMRMKTVQGMLMQYFLMRGFVDIRFVSSSNKLSVDPTTPTPTTPTPTTLSTYAGRKKAGVERVTRLLAGTDRLEWFSSHAKKDDLADSLLQGIWFLSTLRKRT